MVKLADLIPEKRGECLAVNLDTDDGMIRVTVEGKEILNVTHGDGKLLMLVLMQAFGKKFTKQMLKVKLNWEGD